MAVKKEKLSHTMAHDKWLKKQAAERISYAGKVPPRQINWQTSGEYKCPELHHRSRGAAVRPVTLNARG